MSSVIQKVASQGVLDNSVRLLSIADTATRALTVDQGLDSAAKLLSLGRSLSRLPARNVTLLTLPTVPDPAAPGRLLPEEPQDDVIFQMILDGQSWRQQLPVQPDGQVSVRVLNGTGTTGLAGQVAARLRRRPGAGPPARVRLGARRRPGPGGGPGPGPQRGGQHLLGLPAANPTPASRSRLVQLQDADVQHRPLLQRGPQRAVQAVLEVEVAPPADHVGEQVAVER
jgi:hypothetical protein